MTSKAVRQAARRRVPAAELAVAHPDLPALLHSTLHEHHERLCVLEQAALNSKDGLEQLQHACQITQDQMRKTLEKGVAQTDFNRDFLLKAVRKLRTEQEDNKLALGAKADRELAQCTADIKELWAGLVRLSNDIEVPIQKFREGERRYQDAYRLLQEQVTETQKHMKRLDQELLLAMSHVDAWQETVEANTSELQRGRSLKKVPFAGLTEVSLEAQIEAAQIDAEDDEKGLARKLWQTAFTTEQVRQWSRRQRSHSRGSSASSEAHIGEERRGELV